MHDCKRFVAAAASLVALAVCGPSVSSANTKAAEAAFQAATVAWTEACITGNVDNTVALYAEDALVMAPQVSIVKGHAALREFIVTSQKAEGEGLKLTIAENGRGVSGDLAWHSGTDASVNAAGTTVMTGKWMQLWRKMNGKWLIIRAIWTDDAAPAPAPAALAN
jgi:ketosteroid isomerase-like protein